VSPDSATPDSATPAETPITATAEDYLKAIWSSTEWGGDAITTKGLAERFGTTAATASDTVRRLAGQGLVRHEPYRAITLTASGERHAIAMVRRHRLIETFLVVHLGYDWAEVHDEAERLEHAASDLMIDRIDALLGHPGSDPHGDPIPTREGEVTHPPEAVRLSHASPGPHRVLRVADSDGERLAYFRRHGLVPGAAVGVAALDRHANTVDVVLAGGARLALAAPATDAVVLLPEAGGREG
jgi:DtxR family Mn-dependent transcriptional regulator